MVRLDRRYILPVALALVLFIVFFAITEQRRNTVVRAATQIWTDADRLRLLLDIRVLLADAEAGRRGFLLTGEREYLRPVAAARRALPEVIEELRARHPLEADTTQGAMTTFERLLDAELGDLDATISRYESQGATSGGGVVGMDVHERTVTDLRNAIDVLRVDQRRRIDAATNQWKHEQAINAVIMGAATLLCMLFVVLTAYLLTCDLDRRKSETERLGVEVAMRTQDIGELFTALQQITEKEKGALARELHDELGSLLVAVKMDLSQLRRHQPADNPEVEQRWERIQSALSECIDLKRRVVEQLRPTLLDNMGLTAALKWQLQESCGQAGLLCREHFPDEEPRIARDASIAIFRIVQESLANVVKHAGARTVDVSVELANGDLVVTVEDDGVGLPLERQNISGLHGLGSMRHRAASLGGRLSIEPGAGNRGTRVRATIPMARIAAEELSA